MDNGTMGGDGRVAASLPHCLQRLATLELRVLTANSLNRDQIGGQDRAAASLTADSVSVIDRSGP